MIRLLNLVLPLAVLAAALLGAHSRPANAHQASLAVMAITELGGGRYEMRWENRPTESEGDDYVAASPLWPEDCSAELLILTCTSGQLEGRVGFEGLGVAQSAAMLKIHSLNGITQIITLTPTSPTARISAQYDPTSWEGRQEIAKSYLGLGVEHIMIGIDHLLFVLGLMWIAGSRWRLFKTISAFTIAHSFTLIAVSFGWVGVPENFVNAMIALSIAFIGVEIMRKERGETSITLRRPEVVAFGFGLLHGFGFANGLVELGLPTGAAVLALAAFNIGVEIGQIAFVFVALALAWAWREMTIPMFTRPARPAAYLIGGLAAMWFVDRTVILLWS